MLQYLLLRPMLLFIFLISLLPFEKVLAVGELQELLDTYKDERRYNEVCWLTAHNAFANEEDNWYYLQQNKGFKDQYEFGVRSFMLDIYEYESAYTGESYIALCHEPFKTNESCPYTIKYLLNEGEPRRLKDFFLQVREWLETDKHTIITLFLESYLKDYSLDEEGRNKFGKLLYETGLTDYLFHGKEFKEDRFVLNPDSVQIDEWPTLREMRRHSHRLVIFSDNNQDRMISVASYQETKYNLSLYKKCEMRKEGRGKHMALFVMNNFHGFSFELPEISLFSGFDAFAQYKDINSYGKIMSRVDECKKEEGRFPNFIAVDFVEVGEEWLLNLIRGALKISIDPTFVMNYNLNQMPRSIIPTVVELLLRKA